MEWISVKDRLPEDDKQEVLVFNGYIQVATRDLYEGRLRTWTNSCNCDEPFDNGEIEGVTQWMPLPEPPK